MNNDRQEKPLCTHCKTAIAGERYIVRENNTYCCEHCYFKDTYLDGIIDNIETTYLATIEAFVSAIDAREHKVGNHSLRVTQFAVVTGHAYGIKDRSLVDLYCGALLHDIGKIGIPDDILLKEGPLTAKEESVMHRHPSIGYGIISRIGYLSQSAEIIRSHHEHFGGTGYPRGLKGKEIPVGARVFAVADTLDALTVKRPYRQAVSFEEARKTILADSGTHYDPSVLEAFERASRELKELTGRIFI